MRIFLDMDGVLVDLMHGWLPYLNEISGKNLTEKDVDMWGLEKVYDMPFSKIRKPLEKDVDMWGLEKVYDMPFSKIRKPLHREGFWEELPPYDGAVEFVETLDNAGHEVYIATAPFPSDVCMWGKKMWVENHLPFLAPSRLILAHDKFLLRGDMLVDDKPENLLQFRGGRILFNQPWNINLPTGLMESWFTRVSGYSDILALTGIPY